MPTTPRDPFEAPEPEGGTLDDLPLFTAPAVEPDSLPLQPPSAPFYAQPAREGLWEEEEDADAPEPELLGPAQRPDRSWGSLAAAALLLVALLGAFLWYQRPGSPASPPPPYAPPAVEEPETPVLEEPEVIEELPAEPEPRHVEPVPASVEPVQIAEVEETEEVEPSPAPKRRGVRRERPERPERPRSEEPARIAAASAPPVPKRVVPSGPPASRMEGVLRPGPGVEMPVPLSFPSARYPAAARGRGLRVDVHLDILVDERGKVLEAVVRDGDTSGLGFNEAAVDAVLGTSFQPATRWDLPGKAWTELIIQFEDGAASP